MALILNIETSSPVCSVCLADNGVLIDHRQQTGGNMHARMLTVFIEQLLSENKLGMHQLDAVAVSGGPGSYTGLRIGTSVAKGLCYALNKPLITVPTLLSLAFGIKENTNISEVYYMPVMDARRMDVYTSIFDSGLNPVFETTCVTVDWEFEKSLKGLNKIYIGGNAVEKCKSVFTSESIRFLENIDNDARYMINFSNKKFIEDEFENIAWFEPFYLKEFSV